MIPQRLAALRKLMSEYGIDMYIIFSEDYHGSEYTGEYFRCREYISGFTGSAGTVVVTADEAGLWTDGRYFLQAEEQLKETGITLFKMGEEGVPTVMQYVRSNLKHGQCLGFDGRTVSADAGRHYKELCPDLRTDKDLTGEIWTDRPSLSAEPAWLLPDEYSGESRTSRVRWLADLVQRKGADRFILSSLDDICWLLNIRGNDVQDNPVVLSYMILEVTCAAVRDGRDASENTDISANAIEQIESSNFPGNSGDRAESVNVPEDGGDITENDNVTAETDGGSDKFKLTLYVNESIFSDEDRKTLEDDGVTFAPYNSIYEDIEKIPACSRVMLDLTSVNYEISQRIPAGVTVIDETDPVMLRKAVKSPTELENIRKAHLKDGIALTRFMYWLKKNTGKVPMTEISVAEKLESFRKMQGGYIEPSFDTISGYAAHGAIVHYCATEETNAKIEPKGLLLMDSGGQYMAGTTDVTRTYVMGPLTHDEKYYFTQVLRGNLNLAGARFLYGCRGYNLDILAREPLWEDGVDFNHGTGHGVGYLLNVHEKPNSFRWRVKPGMADTDSAVIEEGMVTSDEPGIYIEGKFGIRHENLMAAVKDVKNEYGQFMRFETLTMTPFDLDGIDPQLMTDSEKKLLNDYHKRVYDAIAPYIPDDEREWLKEATREI